MCTDALYSLSSAKETTSANDHGGAISIVLLTQDSKTPYSFPPNITKFSKDA